MEHALPDFEFDDDDEHALALFGAPNMRMKTSRNMSTCRRRNPEYTRRCETSLQQRQEKLEAGYNDRGTGHAFRAAQTRQRQTNHINTTTEFLVEVGNILHGNGENTIEQLRSAYFSTLEKLTVPFGRILNSNRTANSVAHGCLHEQIKHAISSNSIICQSTDEKALTELTAVIQMVGAGPMRPPVDLLPILPDDALLPFLSDDDVTARSPTPLYQYFTDDPAFVVPLAEQPRTFGACYSQQVTAEVQKTVQKAAVHAPRDEFSCFIDDDE